VADDVERQRKESIAKGDAILDQLQAFAGDASLVAYDAGDDEMVATMAELAEWIERVRDRRPTTRGT
jgi:hypothetical protein